jgi:soluble lytic murein transglycosylase-like protein
MSEYALSLLFIMMSQAYNLPPSLLSSLCYVESRHYISAIHKDDGTTDSLGVCQVKYETAKWLGFNGTSEQLMNPKINVKYAAKYLSYQMKRYNYNITKAVIAYNIGSAKQLTSTKYSDKVLKQWRTQQNEWDAHLPKLRRR